MVMEEIFYRCWFFDVVVVKCIRDAIVRLEVGFVGKACYFQPWREAYLVCAGSYWLYVLVK